MKSSESRRGLPWTIDSITTGSSLARRVEVDLHDFVLAYVVDDRLKAFFAALHRVGFQVSPPFLANRRGQESCAESGRRRPAATP